MRKRRRNPKSVGPKYWLHWEGSQDVPIWFSTMRQVRQEIASQARANGLTYKQAERFAYVMSNSEYEAEQENLSNTFDP